MNNEKKFPWGVVIVVAIFTALVTAAVFFLRSKYFKRLIRRPADKDGFTCMSFDCCPDDGSANDGYIAEDDAP